LRSFKLKNRTSNRRSIYILPNIFTTLCLFFGFYSILASIDARYSLAAWFIFISALCDGLDGTVARMTNTTSRFGVEYDSLCDLVAFGTAPAVLAYLWALTPGDLGPQYPRLGVAAAFIFLACGALRLARFNVFAEMRDPGFFQGLPIPGGGLMLAATVLWYHRPGCESQPSSFLILALVLALAFLMVSSMDYVSHKNKLLFRNRRPFETLVAVVLFMGLIIAKNRSAFLPLGLVYLASGPVVTAMRTGRRRRDARAPAQATPEASKTPQKDET
jgi:CDP-diacylglycerol--serine O-phosphatidyltransferase